jgi:hypothetical protein
MGKTKKKSNGREKNNVNRKSVRDFVRQEMKEEGMSSNIENELFFIEEDEDEDEGVGEFYDDTLFI